MTDLFALLDQTKVMILDDCEAINIQVVDVDEQCVHGIGEETGENYIIKFDEIDVNTTMFYAETLIDEKDYQEDGRIRLEAKLLFNTHLNTNPQILLDLLKSIKN